MRELLNEVLGVAVPAIATLVVGLLTTVVSKYLGSKVSISREESIKESIDTLITNTVVSVYQTYVDTLKKKGMFNSSEQVLAYTKASNLIKDNLTIKMSKYIKSRYKDIDTFISTSIETKVSNLKEAK
jgi:hypothetical protein